MACAEDLISVSEGEHSSDSQPRLTPPCSVPVLCLRGRSIKKGPLVAQPRRFNPIKSKACCPPTIDRNFSRPSLPRWPTTPVDSPLVYRPDFRHSGQRPDRAVRGRIHQNRLIIYVLANARTSSLTASRCCSFPILATLRTTLSNIRSCSVICCGPSCPVSSKK